MIFQRKTNPLNRWVCLLLALPLTFLDILNVYADALWPIPERPIVIMNTLSTLQFYGPTTPGFHHGLDLPAAAGSIVVAPVGGKVQTRYYYRVQTDYTYEIAIITPEGLRWEFHHIDPGTIPEEIERLADEGGSVTAGTVIGRIYDASEIDIEPHVHINVIDTDGIYLNPQAYLPDIGDKVAPVIESIWWATQNDTGFIEIESPRPGLNTLILSAYDTAPGNYQRQSIYSMKVLKGTDRIFEFKFDRLPGASFFEGLDDIYFLDELITLNGTVMRSETQQVRRFLYSMEINFEENEIENLRIVATDFSGNTTYLEITTP